MPLARRPDELPRRHRAHDAAHPSSRSAGQWTSSRRRRGVAAPHRILRSRACSSTTSAARTAARSGLARTVARRARIAHDAYMSPGLAAQRVLALAAGMRDAHRLRDVDGRDFYTERVTYRDDCTTRGGCCRSREPRPPRASCDERSRPTLYPTRDDDDAVDALLGASQRGRCSSRSRREARGAPSGGRTIRMLARSSCADEFDIAIVGGARTTRHAGDVKLRSAAASDASMPRASSRCSHRRSLIRRAAVLVTNDSAPQHLASAMNTPTVAMFGPDGAGVRLRSARARDRAWSGATARVPPVRPARSARARWAIGAACARFHRRRLRACVLVAVTRRKRARMTREQYIIGVDLGGTNIVAGAMPVDGSREIAMRTMPTRSRRRR